MVNFDRDALAAAANSATAKALTGHAGTDPYAPDGVMARDELRQLASQHPDWASAYLNPDGTPKDDVPQRRAL